MRIARPVVCLRAYRRKTQRFDLHPTTLNREPSHRPALALPALCGLLHNPLPYVLPKLCGRFLQRLPKIISTVKLAVGAAAFSFHYLLRAGMTSMLWDWPSALFCGLSLPTSDHLALYYEQRVLNTWSLWRLFTDPQTRRQLLESTRP